jgi:predicted small secreted protein
MKVSLWSSFALGLGLMLAANLVHAQEVGMIKPHTAAAAKTIRLLKRAEANDRADAQSWTADTPELDHYYSKKADEAKELVRQLESGKEISLKQVKHALNNEEAASLGAGS